MAHTHVQAKASFTTGMTQQCSSRQRAHHEGAGAALVIVEQVGQLRRTSTSLSVPLLSMCPAVPAEAEASCKI